jgi:hypothetical protein
MHLTQAVEILSEELKYLQCLKVIDKDYLYIGGGEFKQISDAKEEGKETNGDLFKWPSEMIIFDVHGKEFISRDITGVLPYIGWRNDVLLSGLRKASFKLEKIGKECKLVNGAIITVCGDLHNIALMNPETIFKEDF